MDRILRNTAASLSVEFFTDETSVAADGPVTVTVTDDVGNALVTGAGTTHGVAGIYSWTLPAQSTLKRLTLAWTGTFSGVVQTLTTHAEVVGARLFSLDALRSFDSDLADTVKYPTAKLEEARTQVEDEFEAITGLSFIPRYGNTSTVGGGSAYLRRLDHYEVTRILAAYVSAVALSAPDIAGLTVQQDRLLKRATGVWTELAPVVVHYEHGLDDVDSTVADAAMLRARTRLNMERSGISEYATAFDTPEGTTVDLSRPSVFTTGVPEVDAVLARYMTPDALAAAAAIQAVTA